MEVVILTTSHGQIRQVQQLLFSLSQYAQSSSSSRVSCVIVESYLDSDCYDELIDHFSAVLGFLKIVCVDSGSYWTGSVFSGLEYISLLSSTVDLIDSSRVVLVNCDVLPSSWNFLLEPRALLETLVTVSMNNIVKRSGFCLVFPFLALHNYPYNKKPLPSSDWFCDAVPTRLIVLPFKALPIILAHRYLAHKLPHYSADFIVTSLISSQLSTSWRVRVDYSLIEDETTTGFKNIRSINFGTIRAVLFDRKSAFNIRDAFFFPIFFSQLSLPLYCRPSYVISYWFKYLIKIIALFFFASFGRLLRERSI